MRAQALRHHVLAHRVVAKETMELNPKHAIVKALREKFDSDSGDSAAKDLVMLLYETALLTSGFSLDNPAQFSSRIHRLVKLGLSIDDDDDEEEDAVDEDVPV